MTTPNSCSKLDSSAAEFVPGGELLKQLAKREALAKIKTMVDRIFTIGGKAFQSQLDQLFKLATMKCEVDVSQLVGYVLGQSTLESPDRCTLGFRFFKELRAQLPTDCGQLLEYGVFNAVHEETEAIINGTVLKELQLSATSSETKPTGQCEEAGDVPSELSRCDTARVFALVKYFTLLIMRLNLPDSSDESACIPPAQPCVDLCKLTATVVHMQLTCRVSASTRREAESTSEVMFDPVVLTRRDWIGLLYMLVDLFSQSLTFFNCFLASLNQRVLNGAWHRTGSLEERAKVHENKSVTDTGNRFDHGALLSSLINNVLTCMRELLLEERLPLKMIRSAVLDTLMNASEMAAVNNLTYPPAWTGDSYELPLTEPGSNESEGEEVYECYQQFLLETHQVKPS